MVLSVICIVLMFSLVLLAIQKHHGLPYQLMYRNICEDSFDGLENEC